MSQTCNYGCAQLPTHQQLNCSDYGVGGVSAIAILDCDHTITDFSNASQWTSNITAGRAKLLLGVKGEIPAASPVTIDNPIGCGPEKSIFGMDNTIKWGDSNVLAGNDDMYAKLNLRKGIVVIFMCEEDSIRVSSLPANFSAVPVMVPNTNKQIQMYNVEATFFTKIGSIPMALYSAPAGIFTS